ncbi:MAG TPA: fumarylacetoacetate hydrolase family protein [Tepidisphaeraceae bacterium]
MSHFRIARDGLFDEPQPTTLPATSMKLFQTKDGAVVEDQGNARRVRGSWDDLIRSADLVAVLREASNSGELFAGFNEASAIAPIGSQEVWAAGVTYMRSREARMEEAKSAGGGDFYDRVYNAARPELFFKSSPYRVVGPNAPVRIRRDSKWNVPEPELTLVISPRGQIIGHTIGNDMSSRDIEGENPLYLPQAKSYDGSCAIGPGVYIAESPLAKTTEIRIEILRAGKQVFTGSTNLTRMKREPEELVEYLYRETSFPFGCYLMTGTGVVPPDQFTLDHGDEIRITIDSIGTLSNTVA